MPEIPLGYFLTFATYGSWLHGDARGSKDRAHNRPETDPKLRDDFLRGFEGRELVEAPVWIRSAMRSVLEDAFAHTCAFRGWELVELNVRQQHIHVVLIGFGTTTPERVMNDLKTYGTRALRAAGLVSPNGKFWSRHGSTRHLWREADVEAACEYVANWQGADLPGSTWRNWKSEARA